jgi:translation initiation factor IF-3
MDFGQFRYTIKKEERQSKKQKKIGVVKGVRLTPRIGQHDMEIRVKKTQDFLSQGYKVRIEMILKGREKAHFDLAEEKIKKFINILGEAAQIEQEPKRQGNCLTSIISPLSK